jgi:hypothetical protein
MPVSHVLVSEIMVCLYGQGYRGEFDLLLSLFVVDVSLDQKCIKGRIELLWYISLVRFIWYIS